MLEESRALVEVYVLLLWLSCALTPRISREQRRFAVESRARAVRELDALVSHGFV
jgi:hypothetical protein